MSVTKKINNQSYLNIVGFGSFEFSYKLFLFLHLFQQLPFDFVSHNARFDLSLSNSKSKRFTQYGITEPSSRLHPTIVLEFTTVCSLNRLKDPALFTILTRVRESYREIFFSYIHIHSTFLTLLFTNIHKTISNRYLLKKKGVSQYFEKTFSLFSFLLFIILYNIFVFCSFSFFKIFFDFSF